MKNSHNSPLDLSGLQEYFQGIRHNRLAARDDPSTFIAYCFSDPRGEPIRQAAVHHELQEFLTLHPKALIELPRDHGKSFQVCCRIVWELGHNPGLRVKIVCATGAIAGERARFIRDAIESNRRVQLVFPELRRDRPWAATSFAVIRPANVIGPSITAYGIGAGSTGTRADLLVCDDVVDVRALHNRAERDRVDDHFHDTLMNLLEPEGRFWGLFTPWHGDDLNARLKKNPSYAHFRKAIGPEFEPVWPEKWPAEKLQMRKAEIGSVSFARGYRLVPMMEEDAPIRPEWVRHWTEPAEQDMVVLSIDPAVSSSAKADRSALVVLGRTAVAACGFAAVSAPEIRVLACTARRVAAPALVGLIETFDRQWNPAVILFESNAAFLGIKDLLVRHASFGPRVKGMSQSTDKASRVAAFSVAVENGSFRLKGDDKDSVDAGQSELFEEMTTFPFGEHDDLLDAAATGCAYLLDRREPRVW
jgi:phage terminase large subunit-like protein